MSCCNPGRNPSSMIVNEDVHFLSYIIVVKATKGMGLGVAVTVYIKQSCELFLAFYSRIIKFIAF
jgi:hypothetical protein